MSRTFGLGQQRHCITIPILEDSISEDPELFKVLLSSEDPDFSSNLPETEITITDADDVTVGLEMDTYPTSEEEGVVEVCVVVTDGELDREIAVTLTTSPGTAEGTECISHTEHGRPVLVSYSGVLYT